MHWDLESGAELKRKESTEISEAFDIALSPDNRSLLVGARELMQQFDVEAFTEMKSFPSSVESEWLVNVAFSPDGQTAVAGGDFSELHSCLRILRVENALASSSDDATVKVQDTRTGELPPGTFIRTGYPAAQII